MLIARYLFRQTASALITILISLTLIVWLTSILREIKLLTSQGQTFILFLKITSLAIPNLLVTVAPVALLIGALHTLNRLNGDSELIVLSAAGASVWRVLTPYLLLACAVSIAVLMANLYALPYAARLLGDYVSQVHTDTLSQVMQPGEFSDLEKGLTFHIRDRGPNGEMLGVLVHDERDSKMITTIVADSGEIAAENGRSVMTLHNGQIIRKPVEKAEARIVVFESYLFDLQDLSPKEGPRELKPRERPIGDLLFPDKTNAFYKDNKARFISEIHDRLSTPLYPFLFVLLAVVYLGRPKTTREGRTNILFTAFIIGAIIRILGIAGVNIVGKQPWALSLLYGLPLAGTLIAIMMLKFSIGAPALSFPSLRLPWPLKSTGSRQAAIPHPS